MDKLLIKKGFMGSIFNYAGKTGVAVLGFLIFLVLVRNLPVEDFGIYNLLLSFLTFGLAFTSLGLSQTIERFVPEYNVEKKTNYVKTLFSLSFILRALMATILIVVALLFREKLFPLINFPWNYSYLLPVFAFILFFYVQNQLIGDAFLLANFSHRYWNLLRILYKFFKFSLFFIVLQAGYGLAGIVVVWLVCEILLFLFFSIKTSRYLSLDLKNIKIESKRIIPYAGMFFLITLGMLSRTAAIDNIIISYLLDVESVGYYSFLFGVPLMLLNWTPALALKNLFIPVFVTRFTQSKKKKDLTRLFEFYNKVIMFLSLPLFFGIFIASRPVINYVFNPEYMAVNYLFRIALVFVFFRAFIYPYEVILRTIEKVGVILVGTLFTVLNIAAAFILIPRFELLGAVIASGLTGISILIYYRVQVSKMIKVSYPVKSFFKILFNSLIMGGFIFLGIRYVEGLISLLIVLILAALLYFGLSLGNKCFSDDERRLINEAVGKNIMRF